MLTAKNHLKNTDMSLYFTPLLTIQNHWLSMVLLNPLRPSDAISHNGHKLSLAQVMTYCLTATSHYLNHYWHIISRVLYDSSEGNGTRNSHIISTCENYTLVIETTSPVGQFSTSWIKLLTTIRLETFAIIITLSKSHVFLTTFLAALVTLPRFLHFSYMLNQ